MLQNRLITNTTAVIIQR